MARLQAHIVLMKNDVEYREGNIFWPFHEVKRHIFVKHDTNMNSTHCDSNARTYKTRDWFLVFKLSLDTNTAAVRTWKKTLSVSRIRLYLSSIIKNIISLGLWHLSVKLFFSVLRVWMGDIISFLAVFKFCLLGKKWMKLVVSLLSQKLSCGFSKFDEVSGTTSAMSVLVS